MNLILIYLYLNEATLDKFNILFLSQIFTIPLFMVFLLMLTSHLSSVQVQIQNQNHILDLLAL